MRRRFPGTGDEEMLLRAVMPAGEVDAMLAAQSPAAGPAPARRHYNPDLASVLGLLAGLGADGRAARVTDLSVSKPGFRLELHAQ